MHRGQQKRKNLQEFNFQFNELIQAVTNHEPKYITDPLGIYIYAQKLFNPTVSSTTIPHAHQMLQKVVHCVEKDEREYLLVEGI